MSSKFVRALFAAACSAPLLAAVPALAAPASPAAAGPTATTAVVAPIPYRERVLGNA